MEATTEQIAMLFFRLKKRVGKDRAELVSLDNIDVNDTVAEALTVDEVIDDADRAHRLEEHSIKINKPKAAIHSYFVNVLLKPFASLSNENVLREEIYEWTEECYGWNMSETQRILSGDNNHARWTAIVESWVNDVHSAAGSEYKKVDTTYTLPQTLYHSIINKGNRKQYECAEKCENYMFSSCYLRVDRSAPEKVMERWLLDQGNKLAWIKNLDHGAAAYSLTYNLDGHRHHFHPDYLVQLTSLGLQGIFETKSATDMKKSENTEKLRVLLALKAENDNIVTGFVGLDKNNNMLLYRNPDDLTDAYIFSEKAIKKVTLPLTHSLTISSAL